MLENLQEAEEIIHRQAARVRELEDALRKYGHHDLACHAYWRDFVNVGGINPRLCDCGLTRAMEGER